MSTINQKLHNFPQLPLQLSVENLTVAVKKRDETIILLSDITAVFRARRFTAILGPSGAGKSVLLNCLSGRLKQNVKNAEIKGTIRINQQIIKDIEFLSLITGLIPQEEVMMSSMTVEEILRMTQKLKRPPDDETREDALIENTLSELGIYHIKNVRIGTKTTRVISGAEMKRTGIGRKILAFNPILLADEPTSGLDAFSSFMVVKMLKNLTDKGRTVIATINNSSSEMLEQFDDVLIIAEKGQVIYYGDSSNILNYLQQIDRPCPTYVNPLDFVFIEVMHSSTEENGESDKERTNQLTRSFKISNYQLRLYEYIRTAPQSFITPDMIQYEAPMLQQLKFLIPRAHRNFWRQPEFFLFRLVQTLVLALFLAFVFLQVLYSSNDIAMIYQSLLGGLFFLVVIQVFSALNSTIKTSMNELPVFLQEYSDGYYSVLSYYLTKLSVELPIGVTWPVLTSLIVYWIIGFRPGFDHFLVFTTCLLYLGLIGNALGLAVGFSFRNPSKAAIVSILILMPLIVYGRFFVNAGSSPVWLAWIQWVSPIQYAFISMSRNELQDRTILGESGNDQLEELGVFQRFSIGVNFVFLTAIWLFLLTIAYLALVNSVRAAGLGRYDIRNMRRQMLKMST